MSIVYILLAILAFGVLIAVHEGGHFAAAKLLGVKVNEFAIGMGPVLLQKQRGETMYSLRALPIGGFCAMEGEDEETEDPRAFTAAPRWKRCIILVAGSFMNFLTGLIIVLCIFWPSQAFVTPVVTEVADGFLYGGENGIMPGDEVYKINGKRIYYSGDFSTFMSIYNSGSVDMVLIRDGKKVELEDYQLRKAKYVDDGVESYRYGISFTVIPANGWERLKYGCYEAVNFVRLVFLSFEQMFAGQVGLKDMSGVVGIVDTIAEVGEQSETVSAAFQNIFYLIAFIAVNLAVMNMLPIPALDGGRVFFLLVGFVIEKIIGRKLDPKYEGYVHAAGLVLLMGLMLVIGVSDVLKIIRR